MCFNMCFLTIFKQGYSKHTLDDYPAEYGAEYHDGLAKMNLHAFATVALAKVTRKDLANVCVQIKPKGVFAFARLPHRQASPGTDDHKAEGGFHQRHKHQH